MTKAGKAGKKSDRAQRKRVPFGALYFARRLEGPKGYERAGFLSVPRAEKMHFEKRHVKKNELIEEVRKWANEILQYNAEDKIDDFNIYEWNQDSEEKIIRVMSPLGQKLYFEVSPISIEKCVITLLLDTWR